MKLQKTHTEQKNKTNKTNKSILYQLESIIKTLYPTHKTVNPYEDYLAFYYNELEIEDVLLFKRLLKSITLLNHKERVQSNRRYTSSYADVLTTIELISKHTINDVILRSYVQLKEVFRDHPFTKLQGSRVLRKSIRSIDRYLELWKHLKLVEKTNIKQGSKTQFFFCRKKAKKPAFCLLPCSRQVLFRSYFLGSRQNQHIVFLYFKKGIFL